MLKIAVLISGGGSNLQALIDAAQQHDSPMQIVGVISNVPDVKGLDRAKAAGIPALTINHKDYANRETFESALDAKLNEYGAQLVCLAGFLRVLTPWFVNRWTDRLVNIHPSLLPAFGGGYGIHVHRAALERGVKISGCTVHFVRAEADVGPIIGQAVVPVHDDDTPEALAARVLKAEHALYPQIARWIAEGRVNVMNEKVFVTGVSPKERVLFSP